MSTTPIRVLLAEDHTIVRQGLKVLLGACPDLEVVGEAENGRAAVERAKELQPDVVVMDLAMPELNGVDATREIRAECPATQVVVLSMHTGEDYVRPAIRAGARAFLVKGAGLTDLVAAIRATTEGKAFFSPAVAGLLLSPEDARTRLSEREREVLRLVAEGHSSAAAARLLGLSVKTVEGHRSRIMAKLDVTNVAGLVLHAVKLGLVAVD